MGPKAKVGPVLLFAWTVLSSLISTGQVMKLDTLVKRFNTYKNNTFQEKLFVHTDQAFYLTGDYLRFKIYCVDASSHRPAVLSNIVYVELLNKDQLPVLQAKLVIKDGAGHGTLFLPTSISSGNYTLRAYTRWMINFSPEFFFHKDITIVNTFRTLEPLVITPVVRYDAQFFPEGGTLVQNLKSKVAFRVVDNLGHGIESEGTLLSPDGQVVGAFRSLKFGIGHFEFTPQTEGPYKAIVRDRIGKTIAEINLPKIYSEGLVMNLVDNGSERLEIEVSGTDDKPVTLIVHTRGSISKQETKPLQNHTVTFFFDKSGLGDGISHITILNDAQQPVCERLYFKRPTKQLTITTDLDNRSFGQRSKVDLALIVKDSNGQPVKSEVSISVYRLDSLQGKDSGSITHNLLLTSDLHGRVESPDFYFSNDPLATQAGDNLMLTHGWRRFKWQEIIRSKPQKPEFAPEHRGHTILGKVIDPVTRDSASGVLAYLSVPGKTFHFRGSRSGWTGQVRFEMPDFYGPNNIIVQTDPRMDSSHRVEIISPFARRVSSRQAIPFGISRTMEKQLLSRSMSMQMQNIYFAKERSRIVLPRTDSLPFYHKPDEGYLLDSYTRFPTIEDVMREYVPGVFVRKQKQNFHLQVMDRDGKYAFKDDPMILLDGVPVFNVNDIMAYDPLRVQKLDVVTHRYYFGPLTFSGIVSYTTYKGDLKGFQVNPRATVQNYDGAEWEREFFAPWYETEPQRASRLPDFRNLLAWIPMAKSGNDGTCRTQFYTSDQAGTYYVVVNGLSQSGASGSLNFTFEVTPNGSKR